MKNFWRAIVVIAIWLVALYIAARVNTDRGVFMIFLDMSAVGVVVFAVRWYRQRKLDNAAKKQIESLRR